MFADWSKLPDSSPDFPVVRDASGLSSGYALVATVPSDSGGHRQVGYRCDRGGQVSGSYEVEAMISVTSHEAASLGLAVQSRLSKIDQGGGFYLELFAGTDPIALRLCRGTGADREVLNAVAGGILENDWNHVLLQVRYDRVGNQQVLVATNAFHVHGIDTPVWVGAFDSFLTSSDRAVLGGKIGFVMRGAHLDSLCAMRRFAVRSALSEIT